MLPNFLRLRGSARVQELCYDHQIQHHVTTFLNPQLRPTICELDSIVGELQCPYYVRITENGLYRFQ